MELLKGEASLFGIFLVPMFSKEKDSTNYSRVNTLLVGIRGMIAPLCGAVLYSNFSMLTVLFCAGSCSYIRRLLDKEVDLF